MAKNKSKTKSSALVIPTTAPHAKSASQPATTNGSSSSGSNNNGAEPLLMRLCKHCCEDYSQAVDPNRIKKTFASFKSSGDASCHHAPKCSTCKQLQSTVEDDDLFLNCFNGLFYCPKHAFQKKNTLHGGGIIINISTLKSICLSCPSSTDIGFTRTKSVFHLKQPNDEHINRFVNVLKYVKSQVETCFGSESIYTKSLKMELETIPPRDYQMIQALQILSQTIAAKSAASQSDTDAKWNIQNNQYLSTMRGLYNLGNTCFFNSTMQALTHTHTLASFYLNLSAVYPTLNIPKKITFTDAKSLSFALTLFYNSIYKLPQQQKGELFVPYNPSKLFEAICDKFPLFRGYGQHDATELLRFVCSHVRDEYIDDFKKKNAATTTNSNGSQNETTEPSSASTTVTSIQPPPTVIDDCFKIILNSSVFCSHCGHVSTIKEMAHDLSIPIPKTKENLYLHFKELFEREKKTFEQHAMANGSDDSSSTATSTTNSMMLNPEEVLSTIPQQMNGVHLAHCLWGFVTHDLLEGDDGYRCEKCSHLIDENNEEKTSSNASTNSSDVATSSETSNHTGTTSPTTADNNSSASNKPKYTLRNACKQFSIAQLPQVLTIHLKRFVSMHQMLRKKKRSILDDYLMSTGAHSFMKDNAQIIFPTSIDMAPYIHPSHRQDEENKQTVYDLYAIVEHSGTMHGGHYVAYVKQLIIDGGQQFKRGDWFYISDSHVKKVVSEKQVLEEARPYLLFYEKRRK